MKLYKWKIIEVKSCIELYKAVNSCVDHMDYNFIFDSRVNLDSFFSFVSIGVHEKTG